MSLHLPAKRACP